MGASFGVEIGYPFVLLLRVSCPVSLLRGRQHGRSERSEIQQCGIDPANPLTWRAARGSAGRSVGGLAALLLRGLHPAKAPSLLQESVIKADAWRDGRMSGENSATVVYSFSTPDLYVASD